MNDLGMTLLWLSVQVSLVLVPGALAYTLAARRGPAAGASVATLCLGLVLVLTAAAFRPAVARRQGREMTEPERTSPLADLPTATTPQMPADIDPPARPTDARRPFARWRLAWDRFERGAAEPAARCRPWAGALGVLLLAASGAGLLRLAMGLGAVIACRRRSRPVHDASMIGLLDDLRRAIGCRRSVELREADDLPGPATAGWRRPVILLPDDWRSWDESDRRAVLAHELAHVVRDDYAAGLIARLAVALNAHHPIVWWMAGRLRWQQELAADAIGARLAGSRSGYLVSLSRMALRQDNWSPSWPARAFLPPRGALIRRIDMLRRDSGTNAFDGPWTLAGRLATAALLVGVTGAVMTLRGPARGGEERPTGSGRVPPVLPSGARSAVSSPLFFARAGASGVVLLRPAAAARHAEMTRILPLLDVVGDLDFSSNASDLARYLGIDPSKPGFLKLAPKDLDWITLSLTLGRHKSPKDGSLQHTIALSGPAARTIAPFDWLAFLRQWHLEVTEVREGAATYHRLGGPVAKWLGPGTNCVYLPDDRTIVLDEEKAIRKLATEGSPPRPDDLRGPDWDRASRGWLAVAINNHDDALAKDYDLGRPDDAAALTLLRGVDRWILSVDDADTLAVHAAATCTRGDAGAAITRSLDALVNQARSAWKPGGAEAQPWNGHDRLLGMTRALLATTRIERTDRSVALDASGFGTLADLAALLEVESRSMAEAQKKQDPPKPAKR